MNNKYFLIPLTLIAFLAVAVMSPPAHPSGYNPGSEVTATIPHGGYTTTGNKCKSCHAVHLAETTGTQTTIYRLLRPGAATASTACQYCHGETGIVTTRRAWFDTNGHGLSVDQTGEIVAPDDTTYTAFRAGVWGCIACHSPHAAGVVTLVDEPMTSSKILRRFPNPFKPTGSAYYNGTTGTLTITQWCTNCHEANYGLHTAPKGTPQGTRYGHDVSTAGYVLVGNYARVIPTDTVNNGPKCKQCHSAKRVESQTSITKGFPHAGGDSWKMLGASSTPVKIEPTKLDDLCASEPCHRPTDLP